MLWYDPPSTYWVTSCVPFDGMALLRTEDGGASWETIVEGLGRGYVESVCGAGTPFGIVRTDPVVIYKRYAGYRRSDDRGATWSEVVFPVADPAFPDPAVRHGLAVSARHADRIAYGTVNWPAGLTVIELGTGKSRLPRTRRPLCSGPN
jgi:photosystem II stability/assembly factor-like uncharacterized protein